MEVTIGQNFTLGGTPIAHLFNSLGDLFGKSLLPNVFIIAGILAFFYMLFGGFKYIFSGGKAEEVGKAGGMIMSAVIGLIIIFSAYWITKIITTVLGLNLF